VCKTYLSTKKVRRAVTRFIAFLPGRVVELTGRQVEDLLRVDIARQFRHQRDDARGVGSIALIRFAWWRFSLN
jgi:hypothetical protein